MACKGCQKKLSMAMSSTKKPKQVSSVQIKMGAMKGTKVMNPGRQMSGRHSGTVQISHASNGSRRKPMGGRGH